MFSWQNWKRHLPRVLTLVLVVFMAIGTVGCSAPGADPNKVALGSQAHPRDWYKEDHRTLDDFIKAAGLKRDGDTLVERGRTSAR